MQTADQGLHTISKDVKLAVELAQNLSVLIAWLVGSTAVSRRFRQWMGGMAVKGGMVDIGSGMQVEVTVAFIGNIPIGDGRVLIRNGQRNHPAIWEYRTWDAPGGGVEPFSAENQLHPCPTADPEPCGIATFTTVL